MRKPETINLDHYAIEKSISTRNRQFRFGNKGDSTVIKMRVIGRKETPLTKIGISSEMLVNRIP